MMKILLIEDDETLNFLITDVLSDKGYAVISALDGQVGIDLFKKSSPDIIILDVMLPKIDGFEVAKQVRNTDQNTPIIFLTAKQLKEDKIKGLKIGGDDYITKPFDIEELLLKIEIFLKRSKGNPKHPSKQHLKNINLDESNRILTVNSFTYNLTFKEVCLVSYLLDNPDKILLREEILDEVWGSSNDILSRSLDVFISKVRRFFKSDTSIKIENIHGTGYRFSTNLNKSRNS
ncbi:MAG: response regulator transcription factor [Bacteroidales bacterium]